MKAKYKNHTIKVTGEAHNNNNKKNEKKGKIPSPQGDFLVVM